MSEQMANLGCFLLQSSAATNPIAQGIQHPDISKFLVVGALLFVIGIAGVLIRRNIIVIFMSIELILNAANLNFIAFSRYLRETGSFNDVSGQVFSDMSNGFIYWTDGRQIKKIVLFVPR